MVFQKYNDFVVFPMHIFAVYLLLDSSTQPILTSYINAAALYLILKKLEALVILALFVKVGIFTVYLVTLQALSKFT